MRTIVALSLVMGSLVTGVAFCACQGTARGRRTFRADAVRSEAVPAGPACPPEERRALPRPDPGRIEGTASIRVIWEALHVERQQVLNPRTGRPGIQGIAAAPDLEVVIINSSFQGDAEQLKDNRARKPQGGLSKIDDRDMIELIKSLKSAGFYDYAKPTGAISGLFESERSRGRITIEMNGESLTLLSQRGLGLAEQTKEIPAIYAETKRAIQVMRNRSRRLEVSGGRVSGRAPTKLGDTVEPPATGKVTR